MLPVVILQCQGSLRTLRVAGIQGRDVSFFSSTGLIQRTTSLKSRYKLMVSAESLLQAAQATANPVYSLEGQL